ncbi:MAG: hypothetical protein COA96_03695 [SAR86 cluster bacterium]|uniref:Uncharacterized protein n=1 Tax=SAR86 cluster bacterium TaxID=2030880 RepID=A0A2A5B6Z0_9GAMM|nr:MAG: hypothetical protein COA96_03695 [SAR86 cluster bacterium]
MFKFLRNLISLINSSFNSSRLDELIDIIIELRDSGNEVSVQIDGDSATYTCTVDGFNAKHHVLVISNMRPSMQMNSLQKGKGMRVRAGKHGKIINFECSYLEPLIENQNTALQLKMERQSKVASCATTFNFIPAGIHNENSTLNKQATERLH